MKLLLIVFFISNLLSQNLSGKIYCNSNIFIDEFNYIVLNDGEFESRIGKNGDFEFNNLEPNKLYKISLKYRKHKFKIISVDSIFIKNNNQQIDIKLGKYFGIEYPFKYTSIDTFKNLESNLSDAFSDNEDLITMSIIDHKLQGQNIFVSLEISNHSRYSIYLPKIAHDLFKVNLFLKKGDMRMVFESCGIGTYVNFLYHESNLLEIKPNTKSTIKNLQFYFRPFELKYVKERGLQIDYEFTLDQNYIWGYNQTLPTGLEADSIKVNRTYNKLLKLKLSSNKIEL